MKKNTLRAVIAAAVILVVYHLVAFLIPFVKAPAFWVSYGFALVAMAVAAASIYIAFVKNPDAKSKFYGFPIARIGVIYGIVQLAVSILVMALALWIPWWAAAVVYAIGLAVAVIGLISAEAVADEIKTQDEQLKKDVSLMRALQSKVMPLAGQCADEAAAKAVAAFAEELRYSDPVSNQALAEAEADLSNVVDELQKAVVDGDAEATQQLCRRATVLLAERNRLCKLNK